MRMPQAKGSTALARYRRSKLRSRRPRTTSFRLAPSKEPSPELPGALQGSIHFAIALQPARTTSVHAALTARTAPLIPTHEASVSLDWLWLHTALLAAEAVRRL